MSRQTEFPKKRVLKVLRKVGISELIGTDSVRSDRAACGGT